jgi:hypothetical protein
LIYGDLNCLVEYSGAGILSGGEAGKGKKKKTLAPPRRIYNFRVKTSKI